MVSASPADSLYARRLIDIPNVHTDTGHRRLEQLRNHLLGESDRLALRANFNLKLPIFSQVDKNFSS